MLSNSTFCDDGNVLWLSTMRTTSHDKDAIKHLKCSENNCETEVLIVSINLNLNSPMYLTATILDCVALGGYFLQYCEPYTGNIFHYYEIMSTHDFKWHLISFYGGIINVI